MRTDAVYELKLAALYAVQLPLHMLMEGLEFYLSPRIQFVQTTQMYQFNNSRLDQLAACSKRVF